MTYFKDISEGIKTTIAGLNLSWKHIWQARKSRTAIGIDQSDYFKQDTGIVTLQYPFESFPVPDNGRYRLDNVIDDCIVCDKCVKICPVDCIDIEAIKVVEDLGLTSDGSPKRLHAAIFDIDMAKCCFCGLCTTVCPTECLTMTKTYDFSEYDVSNMNYHFSNLSPAQVLEKKQMVEDQKNKITSL